MVVGVAMWQLGMFNMGGAVPPTSTGFGAIKPILATCQFAELKVWSIDNGFQCQFVNNVGTDVNLWGIIIEVNKQSCFWNMFGERPGAFYKNVARFCTPGFACSPSWCYDATKPPGHEIGCPIIFPKDSVFTAQLLDSGDTICGNGRKPGEVYVVDVDIEYEVEIGGVKSRKHSTGTVRLTGT
jgi:hypothetical protein